MNRFVIILFLMVCGVSIVKADLFLQIYTDDLGVSIDTTGFPYISAKLKAYDTGKIIDFTKDDIYITENKYSTRPISAVKVENDYYKVTWKTSKISFRQIETASIYLNYNSETKGITGGYYPPGVGSFVFVAYDFGLGKPVGGAINGPINLGVLKPNNKYIYYYFIDVRTPFDTLNRVSKPFSMNSVTIDNEHFKVEWLGATIDQNPLPNKLIDLRYFFRIEFTPTSEEVYQTELVFDYEPGIKRRHMIIANKPALDAEQSLKLLAPNGGQIFTPCEDVIIKWTGHIKHIPVIISYSSDNGNNWNVISSVKDSVFVWKVPQVVSEDMRIKVEQEFREEPMLRFHTFPYKNFTLCYDNKATQLLAAAKAGKILVYDLVKNELKDSVLLGEEGDLSYRFNILGAGFSDANDSYVIGYNDANNMEGGSYSFFRKYTLGKSIPDYTIAVGKKFNATEMFKDYSSKYLVFMSYYSSKVLVYDFETGVLLKELDLDHPITSMELSRKEPVAIVTNLNNEIIKYTLPDFSIIKTVSSEGKPVIENVNISPNGKYVIEAVRKADEDEGAFYNNLMEFETEKIISFTDHNYSAIQEIQFNPFSTTVAIAASGVPQVSFLDLKKNGTIQSSISIGGSDMFDCQYAPDGFSVASCMVGFPFVDVINFVYPEWDDSDETFSVRMPEVAGDDVKVLPMHLLMEERSYTYDDLENIGETKFFTGATYFKKGIHFKLDTYFGGDTLLPGENFTYSITVKPQDVGLIRDTLIVENCYSFVKIPFEVEVQNRHLGFENSPLDFVDEVCLGDTLVKRVKLFTNLDPLPITINSLSIRNYPTSFKILTTIKDTILNPGQSLTIDIAFAPLDIGLNTDSIRIFHSDRAPYYIPLGVQGTGIGAFVQYSHDILPFIEEIPIRELLITNTGSTPIVFTGSKVSPEDSYVVVSQMPITIMPGETKTISIKWNGQYRNNARLNWEVEPCLVKGGIDLVQYSSDFELSIPNIETKPLDMVSIPLIYKFSQNVPYKGVRDFITEIKLYKRLFKPESISSDFGEVSILDERTDDYYRYIKLQVKGDFDTTRGIAATITGYPGLADVIETNIDYSEGLPQWGVNTQGTFSSGKLTIIGVGDRRLLTPDNPVFINSVTPNPAVNSVALTFETLKDMNLEIVILDNLGQEVYRKSRESYSSGIEHSLQLDCSKLPQGNYTIAVKSSEYVSTKQLVIIR